MYPVNCVFVVVEVFCHFLHHTEDAELCRCQDTFLFHAVGDGEGFREVVVQSDLVTLVFMQLGYHAKKLWETAEAFHDQP